MYSYSDMNETRQDVVSPPAAPFPPSYPTQVSSAGATTISSFYATVPRLPEKGGAVETIRAHQFEDEIPIEVRGKITQSEYEEIILQVNARMLDYFHGLAQAKKAFGRKCIWIAVLAIPTMGLSAMGILCAIAPAQRAVRDLTGSLSWDIMRYLRRVNDALLVERGVQLRFSLSTAPSADPRSHRSDGEVCFGGPSSFSITFGMAPVALTSDTPSTKGGLEILKGISMGTSQ
uniref:Uncharacterized protein n=1 Tax=Sexangularia sp. CB-2014 TaxID=1486929 RepID=A0A7S1VS76_9EUKA